MNAILPGATLGLIGGGQLGALFATAARHMGYRVLLLEPDASCPASHVAHEHLACAYDDEAALTSMARRCAAVTTEFENVPAASLAHLARYLPVRPAAEAVAIIQDRVREKSFLRDAGFATARFAAIESEADIHAALPWIGTPAVLKSARLGYDGKGQSVLDAATGVRRAYQEIGGGRCVLEERIELACEISIILARGHDGEVRRYAATENRHRNGILDMSLAPARIDARLAQRAAEIAEQIAMALNYVGVMAVEFFVARDGRLLVNELAPRPHNSGHWTLDAAISSQFEQQVRALCGLPLGETRHHSAFAMVNLLGELWRDGRPPAWEYVLASPDTRLWLYGKREARRGRKMGHYTCRAASVAEALRLAEDIQTRLQSVSSQPNDGVTAHAA